MESSTPTQPTATQVQRVDLPNLISTSQYALVEKWLQDNGAFAGRPAPHALKCLEEVVELCIASGATEAQIDQVINTELNKASKRGEIGKVSQEKMAEEAGDSTVTLAAFAIHFGLNMHSVIGMILDKLAGRTWAPDEGGVLRRPRTDDSK